MAEQLTIGGGLLPVALVVAFNAHELRAKRKPTTLTARSVLRERGRWWIELLADGRQFALINRVDLEVAAADLYHQVHGEAPRTAAGEP